MIVLKDHSGEFEKMNIQNNDMNGAWCRIPNAMLYDLPK